MGLGQYSLLLRPSIYDTSIRHNQDEKQLLTFIFALLAIVINATLRHNIRTTNFNSPFWYQDGRRKWSS